MSLNEETKPRFDFNNYSFINFIYLCFILLNQISTGTDKMVLGRNDRKIYFYLSQGKFWDKETKITVVIRLIE